MGASEPLDGPLIGHNKEGINKARDLKKYRMTLRAPWWPQREWIPEIVSMLVEVPRAFPRRENLLLQPKTRAQHQGCPLFN